MSDIATDILEGNIGKKQEKKKPPTFDIATEILEGITPVQTEIGGKKGGYLLQTEEEPTGKVSTITTKPEMKPVPVDVQRAGFGTLTKAGLVDDPETKLDILSKNMGIPRERFGMVEGRPVYQGDDGILYYVTPKKAKLKGMAAETLARSPSIVMGTLGASAGPWTAALGAAGGEAIRKNIGSLVYKEPQTIAGNIKSMGTEAALAYGGEKILGRGIVRSADVAKGRQGARLIKAAGRGRERISLAESRRISALGKKHGIHLLPPQTTRSPELISRFNLLADLPETADRIGGVRRAQAEQVQTAINKMLDSIAPATTTAESAGKAGVKAADKGITAAMTVRANKARPLYTKAFASGVKVNTKGATKEINTLLKKTVQGDPSFTALTKIKKMISSAKGNLEKLDRVKRRGIDAVLDKSQADKTLRREMKLVKDKLTESMDTVSPDYAKARKIWGSESDVFEQLAGKKRLVGKLAKLEGDEVEKAAGLLFKSSPEIINKAKPVIVKYGGDDTWNALLRTHLTKSFESIKETVTGGVTNLGGRFRQKVFGDLQQRKILKAAMSPEQYKNLEGFAEVLDRAGLILGRESTTATRLIQLEEFGGTAAQTAKAIAYPLHTWKMTVYKKVMNLLGGKYNERLADAMLSPKAAKQLENMLQLKPGSQKLLQQLGTFVTLVGGRQYLQELQKKRTPDIPPEAIAGKPRLIQQAGP